MITGPLIGEPYLSSPNSPAAKALGFPDAREVPRAVSRNYFEQQCPEEERTYIDSDSVNDESIRYDNNMGAQAMFDRWVDRLSGETARCIEITQDSPQLFDIWCVSSFARFPSSLHRIIEKQEN